MQGQIYTPPLTPVNKGIIIVCGGFFLLQSLIYWSSGVNLVGFLGLTPKAFAQGHIYQVFIYWLPQPGLLATVFNGLIIWFIGSELESRWGRTFYLKFILMALSGAAVIFIVLTWAFFSQTSAFYSPMHGVQGLCYALLLAYGIIFSERILYFMMIFPLKAKYFCAILIGIELFMAVGPGFNKSSLGHLGAMLCGFLYLKYQSFSWKKAQLALKAQAKKRQKSKLTLIKNEQDDEPDKNDPRFWQ